VSGDWNNPRREVSMRLIKLAFPALLGLAFLASTADAAPVLVGSPMAAKFATVTTIENGTVFDLSLGEPGALASAPVTGAIVRWHLLGAEIGPFRLRVLHPAGGKSYTGTAASSWVNPVGPGLQTFPASIPIQAGDTIGLDLVPGVKIGATPSAPGSVVAAWQPALPDGATEPYAESFSGSEAAFNAEVQPAPTVNGVSPRSGSIAGGTPVSVSGTDFANVSSVKFGATPAAFTLGSEGQITATAPRGIPGRTGVTVTRSPAPARSPPPIGSPIPPAWFQG
jgi:hypothetical protein